MKFSVVGLLVAVLLSLEIAQIFIYVPISVDSKRCVASIISFSNVKFLLINVYMPTDAPQSNEEYEHVLHEINLIMQLHNDINNVILGGDFNTDCGRQSVNTTSLKSFCERGDLFLVNDSF